MQMLKKSPSDKINVTKMYSFPIHHSCTFNSRFLYELKHKVRLCKSVCGIFHFQFCFVFMKFTFFSTKCVGPLTLKRYNSL